MKTAVNRFPGQRTASAPGLCSVVSLRFVNPNVESRYSQYHWAWAWAGDVQASFVQGLFSIAIILAARKFASVNACSRFSVTQLVGSALQLLLAFGMQQSYGLCRPWLCLWFRLLYLIASYVGLGGPVQADKENAFSAFLWRGGIISIAWHSSAFPLLFWQNILVQAGYMVVYSAKLTPAVCGSLASVHLGEELVKALHTSATELWALLESSGNGQASSSGYSSLAAATGSHLLLSDVQMDMAAWRNNGSIISYSSLSSEPLSSSSSRLAVYSSSSSAALAREQCIDVMVWLHFLVGVVLPAVILYTREAGARARWWQALSREQQQRMMRPEASSTSHSALVFFFAISTYLLTVVDLLSHT